MNGQMNQAMKQTDTRKPAVAEKLDGLFTQLESLHSMLGVLEDRLHPISTPAESTNGGATAVHIPTLSAVARQIDEATERAYGACQRIEAILQRLEV